MTNTNNSLTSSCENMIHACLIFLGYLVVRKSLASKQNVMWSLIAHLLDIIHDMREP